MTTVCSFAVENCQTISLAEWGILQPDILSNSATALQEQTGQYLEEEQY